MRPRSIRPVLVTYLFFFVLLFGLGFFMTRQEQKKEAYMANVAVSRLDLVKSRGHNCLVYRPDGRRVWVLDLETNAASFVDPNDKSAGSDPEPPGISPVDIDFINMTLVSMSTAWSLKEVLATGAKPRGRGRAGAGVLGYLSGFEFGKLAAAHYRPDYSEREIVAWLAAQKSYDDLRERAFAWRFSRRYQEDIARRVEDYRTRSANDPHLRDLTAFYDAFLQRNRDAQYVPTGRDFDLFIFFPEGR